MKQIQFSRRSLLLAGSGLALTPKLVNAQAEKWPSQPVRFVVPFPPGGTSDVLARLLATRLSAKLGQQFLVDNKPGAGGNIGAIYVATVPATDRHTILLAATSIVVNPSLYPDSKITLFKDLVPVMKLVDIPCVVIVRPDLKVASLSDLIAFAKAQPGKLTLVSAGYGTVSHVAGDLLKKITGIDMTHVPFKGNASQMLEILSGRGDVAIDLLSGPMQQILAGKVRAIAVTTPARIPEIPDVATALEQGVKGFDVAGHQSVWAPGTVPAPIIATLRATLAEVMQEPEIVALLKRNMMLPASISKEETEKYFRDDLTRWSQLISASGAAREMK